MIRRFLNRAMFVDRPTATTAADSAVERAASVIATSIEAFIAELYAPRNKQSEQDELAPARRAALSAEHASSDRNAQQPPARQAG